MRSAPQAEVYCKPQAVVHGEVESGEQDEATACLLSTDCCNLRP